MVVNQQRNTFTSAKREKELTFQKYHRVSDIASFCKNAGALIEMSGTKKNIVVGGSMIWIFCNVYKRIPEVMHYS
ncbi:UNVERIFIED_CONTAM: hypothetical protein FKN15_000593 [Acipenser sinensis]